MKQLNSQNKTILVFADPHQEIAKVKKIIEAEKPDVSVCLGDWFDSFTNNSMQDVQDTCAFLKSNLFDKAFVTCLGNHDIQYLYENVTTICSGYERGKDMFIQDFFNPSLLPTIRKQFRWYIWIDDFLCTHAGLSPTHLPPGQHVDKKGLSKWLDEQIGFAEIALESGQRHWLYGAGRARGGWLNRGGIDWMDFNHEFEPIEGLKQLVGHTVSRHIRNHQSDGSVDLTTSDNLCIDCHLNEYLLIRNGKLTIKRFIEL